MPGALTTTPVVDEFLYEDTFVDTDWLEAVDDPRTDVISRDRSQCTLSIYVPYSRYKAAITFILGYSWVDQELKLRRNNPIFHPQWPWLFARAVTNVTFIRFTGKDQDQVWDGAVQYATYEWAKVTIEFAEVRYEVWSDTYQRTIAGTTRTLFEYERHVEKKYKPYTELLQVDGGQMKAHAPGVTAVNGKPLPHPHVLVRVEKSAFDLIWYEVPREFIEDEYGRTTKLQLMQKAVNSDTFMGYRPGTLLCEEIETVATPSPIATDINQGLTFTMEVTFKMKVFDPTPADNTVAKYGWVLLPGPRNTTAAEGDTFTGWFYYTHDGSLTGKPAYKSYEFAKAFTHRTLT